MRIRPSVILGAMIATGLLALAVTGSLGAATRAGAAGSSIVYVPFVPNAFAPSADVSATSSLTFQPSNVTVVAGTTVSWKNVASFDHTVTSDTLLFDQNPLAPGANFSFTFTTPGTYAYHCRFHGAAGGIGMSGTITVVPPGAGA